MFKPKDYVQPRKDLFCTITKTTGTSRNTEATTIQTHEIFKVFTCTWVEYKNDYQLVLFIPNIQYSLTLFEGYGRDFEKIVDPKRLKTLRLLYG